MLIGHVEPRRHDADHRALAAVDLDLLTDETRIAGECALPDFVRQHDDERSTGPRLRTVERPSPHRGDAERLEQISRRLDGDNLAGTIRGRQVRLAGRKRANRGERLHALLKVEEFRRRNPELIESKLRKLTRDVDQPAWLRIAERSEDDPVDDGEDRRVRADPECEGHDRDDSKSRRPKEIANRVAHIANETVHREPPETPFPGS